MTGPRSHEVGRDAPQPQSYACPHCGGTFAATWVAGPLGLPPCLSCAFQGKQPVDPAVASGQELVEIVSGLGGAMIMVKEDS